MNYEKLCSALLSSTEGGSSGEARNSSYVCAAAQTRKKKGKKSCVFFNMLFSTLLFFPHFLRQKAIKILKRFASKGFLPSYIARQAEIVVCSVKKTYGPDKNCRRGICSTGSPKPTSVRSMWWDCFTFRLNVFLDDRRSMEDWMDGGNMKTSNK